MVRNNLSVLSFDLLSLITMRLFVLAQNREPCCKEPTMSAKSLGTLPVIYAVDEQQNPLPRKTMLFEGDTSSTGGRNDVFPSS